MAAQLIVCIQGQLQNVFDALYEMGVIDPVLQMDWSGPIRKMDENSFQVRRAVELVNQNSGEPKQLRATLEKMDRQTLEWIAIAVAKEYAEFHSRQGLH